MNTLSVSIILPNYNGRVLLEKNLPTVIAAVGNSQIIVVDDASTDGSIAMLKKNFPRVTVINHLTNQGFSSSVNNGVQNASSDIVLLLNSDIVPKPHFLEKLLPYFNDPNVFAVGCLQKCLENGKVVLRGRGIGNFIRGFLIHAAGDTKKADTLWVSGGAAAYRKSVWDKLGGMDQLYNPFYWEDIDISYRALKTGYRIVFEPNSIVEHNQSTGSIRTRFSSFTIKEIAYRNQFIFYWKNITDKSLLLEHLIWLPYHIMTSLICLDFAFIFGLLSACFIMPDIIKKRQKYDHKYVIDDKLIVRPFINEMNQH